MVHFQILFQLFLDIVRVLAKLFLFLKARARFSIFWPRKRGVGFLLFLKTSRSLLGYFRPEMHFRKGIWVLRSTPETKLNPFGTTFWGSRGIWFSGNFNIVTQKTVSFCQSLSELR